MAAIANIAPSSRIALLQQVFEANGYKGDAAFIRARVAYFHQVGYYTLGIRESRETRARLLPQYLEVLLGRRPTVARLKALNQAILNR